MKKLLLSFAALCIAAMASAQTDVTFDFNANEWGHGVTVQLESTTTNNGNITEAIIKDGVEIVCKQSKNSTPPRFYASYSAPTVPYLRILSNHIVKVFAPEGKAVTKIEFEMNSGSLALTSESGLSGLVWEGNASHVKFVGTATNQIKKMVVTYTDMNAETTIPKDAEENVYLDIDDGTIHSEFMINNGDTEYLSEDLVLVDGHRDSDDKIDGESLVTTTFKCSDASATSKNRIQRSTRSGAYTTSVRMYDGDITIKTDPDKVIKTLKMDIGNSCYFTKINGNSITKDELVAGYDINANEVVLAIEETQTTATIIYYLTYTLADKPITPYSPATGINNAEAEKVNAAVVKKYVDGKQVVIEKNGKKYNVAGAQIK